MATAQSPRLSDSGSRRTRSSKGVRGSADAEPKPSPRASLSDVEDQIEALVRTQAAEGRSGKFMGVPVDKAVDLLRSGQSAEFFRLVSLRAKIGIMQGTSSPTQTEIRRLLTLRRSLADEPAKRTVIRSESTTQESASGIQALRAAHNASSALITDLEDRIEVLKADLTTSKKEVRWIQDEEAEKFSQAIQIRGVYFAATFVALTWFLAYLFHWASLLAFSTSSATPESSSLMEAVATHWSGPELVFGWVPPPAWASPSSGQSPCHALSLPYTWGLASGDECIQPAIPVLWAQLTASAEEDAAADHASSSNSSVAQQDAQNSEQIDSSTSERSQGRARRKSKRRKRTTKDKPGQSKARATPADSRSDRSDRLTPSNASPASAPSAASRSAVAFGLGAGTTVTVGLVWLAPLPPVALPAWLWYTAPGLVTLLALLFAADTKALWARRIVIFYAAASILLGLRATRQEAADLGEGDDADALWARRQRGYARFAYKTIAHVRGFFVKAGQYLSSRSDVLPAPFVRELSKVQDAMPSTSFHKVRAIVEADLELSGFSRGTRLEDVFSSFGSEPIASASIAQVHRAVLRAPTAHKSPSAAEAESSVIVEGTGLPAASSEARDVASLQAAAAALPEGQLEVAVKVQHPDIEPMMLQDAENLATIVWAVALFEPDYDFRPVLDEWRLLLVNACGRSRRKHLALGMVMRAYI